MALPKWNEERTNQLANLAGDSPVSVATVAEAAEALETSTRSVASKLRKMGYEVESVSNTYTRSFTEKEEATLQAFVTKNSGEYTFAEIAEHFANGKFNTRQIQGKLLSMELTSHVKPTPQKEAVRQYTDEEEAQVIELCNSGAFVEDIAAAVNKTINSVRGKALSLLRAEKIEQIPPTRDHAPTTDILEGVDVASLTVAEIAEQIDRTPRGVKTMLTRRGLTAVDYDGAKRKAKSQEG